MTKPNLSLNGIPGTLWEIRRQENVHPYLGLRQAVLIVNAQQKALREGRLGLKKIKLKLKTQQQELAGNEGDELEILLDEIEITKCDIASFDQLLLDAETELRVAIEEQERIEALNPSMVDETYETLQGKYANEAFQNKLARAVVIAAYSSHKMISEGAAEVIYDSACFSPTDRRRFEANLVSQLRQLLPPEPANLQALITNGGLNGSGAK